MTWQRAGLAAGLAIAAIAAALGSSGAHTSAEAVKMGFRLPIPRELPRLHLPREPLPQPHAVPYEGGIERIPSGGGERIREGLREAVPYGADLAGEHAANDQFTVG